MLLLIVDEKVHGHEDLEVFVRLVGGRVNDIVVKKARWTVGHDLQMIQQTMMTA
jgi:hypothetical protein